MTRIGRCECCLATNVVLHPYLCTACAEEEQAQMDRDREYAAALNQTSYGTKHLGAWDA